MEKWSRPQPVCILTLVVLIVLGAWNRLVPVLIASYRYLMVPNTSVILLENHQMRYVQIYGYHLYGEGGLKAIWTMPKGKRFFCVDAFTKYLQHCQYSRCCMYLQHCRFLQGPKYLQRCKYLQLECSCNFVSTCNVVSTCNAVSTCNIVKQITEWKTIKNKDNQNQNHQKGPTNKRNQNREEQNQLAQKRTIRHKKDKEE